MHKNFEIFPLNMTKFKLRHDINLKLGIFCICHRKYYKMATMNATPSHVDPQTELAFSLLNHELEWTPSKSSPNTTDPDNSRSYPPVQNASCESVKWPCQHIYDQVFLYKPEGVEFCICPTFPRSHVFSRCMTSYPWIRPKLVRKPDTPAVARIPHWCKTL